MRSRDRDERGATLLITAALTVVLVMVTAFAVDLGMQRVVRRDMQAVADVAALDLSRLLTGKTVSQYARDDFDSALAESLGRNYTALGDELTTVACTALGSQAAGVCWEFMKKSGDSWVVAESTDVADAVRVRAKSTVGFAFGGITGVRGGSATRTAVATAESEGCFQLGSYAARLDSGSAPLLKALVESALGGSINLDAVSYQGLVDADVSLLAIAASLGLGTVDELLEANVTARSFALATARALRNGGGDTADVAALETIAAKVGSHTIRVGSLVSAESGGDAAETLTVNGLDMVAGAVFLANGTNFLHVPAIHAALPLVGASLTTTVSLIEKARRACGRKGRTRAETSQLAVTIHGTVAAPPKVLGVDVVGGATMITLHVAPARGLLTEVICGDETDASPSGEDIQVASGLVTSSVSTRVDVNGTVRAGGPLDGLLSGLPGLLSSVGSLEVHGSVDLTAGMSEPSTVKTALYRVVPRAWQDRYALGTGDLGLNAAWVTPESTLTIKAKNLLGLDVSLSADQILKITDNLVSSLVSSVSNPLITAVNASLLAPVSDLLGLTLGGADVYAQKPNCAAAQLVG